MKRERKNKSHREHRAHSFLDRLLTRTLLKRKSHSKSQDRCSYSDALSPLIRFISIPFLLWPRENEDERASGADVYKRDQIRIICYPTVSLLYILLFFSFKSSVVFLILLNLKQESSMNHGRRDFPSPPRTHASVSSSFLYLP